MLTPYVSSNNNNIDNNNNNNTYNRYSRFLIQVQLVTRLGRGFTYLGSADIRFEGRGYATSNPAFATCTYLLQ